MVGSVAILESMAGGQCWCKMSITLDTDAILDFWLQMVNKYEETDFIIH